MELLRKGDIDDGIKTLTTHYPQLLADHGITLLFSYMFSYLLSLFFWFSFSWFASIEELHFKLLCQQYIEYIRKKERNVATQYMGLSVLSLSKFHVPEKLKAIRVTFSSVQTCSALLMFHLHLFVNP